MDNTMYQETIEKIEPPCNKGATDEMELMATAHAMQRLRCDVEKERKLIGALADSTKSHYKTRFDSALAEVQETAKNNQAIRAEVAELMERSAELDAELSKTSEEMEQVDAVSSQVFQEAMDDLPMEKHICSLLRSMTGIEWDAVSCKDNTAVKGTFVTQNEVKPFGFDLKSNELQHVQEKLWDMMEEGQKFARFVDLGT